MERPWALNLILLILVALVPLGGCDDGPAPDGDGDVDGDGDGDGDGDSDADEDGDADADLPPEEHPRNPIVTECPGPMPPAPAEGTCSLTPGSGEGLLIVGTALTPGEVLRGGQVLVDGDGNITCVGCDCDAAADVTRLDCLHGVISPGLINTHDHLTFCNNDPAGTTEERYEHRHHWRTGSRGHARIDYDGGAHREEIMWAELRMIMGGATSINGSGGVDGFLRNLDHTDQEGLGIRPVEYSTFPLGDSSGTLLVSGCSYPDIETAGSIADEVSYTPHVAEGIDQAARNEFLCMRQGSTDLVQEQSAFIHGVGLLPVEIAEMALDGTDLIWSPRTNEVLYGDTARVTIYHALGVRIALGTDWIVSGSMNMIRELQCADMLNDLFMRRADGLPYFTEEELWLMATREAAEVLGAGDVVGTLAPGQAADIAIFDGSTSTDHRAVIDASPEDVVLVLRRTAAGAGDLLRPLYGDVDLVQGLPGGSGCDPLEVCGVDKAVCVSAETGGDETLASLQSANSDQYPLFFCSAEPDHEPTCLPWRDAGSPWPSPEVEGSNRYTGESSIDDADGDGIVDEEDDCPSIFNPIRPMDGGRQADFDGDGVGDACDPCPLHPDVVDCELPSRDDLDADGAADVTDNCPRLRNPLQEDSDDDGTGDMCDACPTAPNPDGSACPATIYDIKDPAGTFSVGQAVFLEGVIVTGVADNGFFVQEDPSGAGYLGAPYSGLFLYTSVPPEVAVADRVDIDAYVSEYNCQIQLGSPEVTVRASGVTLPAPIEVTTADIAAGTTGAEEYESVLVRVTGASVTDDSPAPCMYDSGEGEVEVSSGGASGSVLLDDYLYAIDPLPATGESLASITGVLATRYCCTKLNPRGPEDLTFGSSGLDSLEPALSYAWEGATGTTFPEPLRVTLTRIASSDVTVTLTSSSAGLVVDDVVVPAGSLSVDVPLSATTASATPYVVTASLGGFDRTAQVRVVGAGDVARLSALSPADSTISAGASQEMVVRLDLPAPSGGVVVGLSLVGGGTIPASVTVLHEATEATFWYVAPSAAATAEVTATLGADALSADVDVVEGLPPGLVINEVDYDSVDTDSAEFVEIYNASSAAVSLDGLSVITFNGATDSEVARYPLTGTLGAGEFLLLAGDDVAVPAGVASVRLPDNSLQNGAPDGLALFDTVGGEIVDALCYEGSMTAVSMSGVSGTLSLVEGTATRAEDNNGSAASLIRHPDGVDTDVAADDWVETTTPTPGAPNIP